MVNITKEGQTLVIKDEKVGSYFPCSMVCAHADNGSDSVEIKLKASRKTIYSFNYKDAQPAMGSATAMVDYISSLI